MSTIQTLENLKNKIINKLVTVKSVEETKNKEMLKGGFLKQFFKYVFFKPMHFNKLNSNVDKFFIDDEGSNFYKSMTLLGALGLGVVGVGGLLFLNSIDPAIIAIAGMSTLITIFIITLGAEWVGENRKTKKKFNINNIENIKINLLKNYNDLHVRELLKNRLDKKELTEIMKLLEKSIGKDEIVRRFETIRKAHNYDEIFDDISNPYVLVKLIEKIILDLEQEQIKREKDENSKEKEIKKFNNVIIDSLISDGAESNKDGIESFNIKEHIQNLKNLKEKEEQQSVKEI